MIGKLLSLLTTAKSAVAVGVIAAAGVTGGVATTNPDVQSAITATVAAVTRAEATASPSSAAPAKPSPSAKPSDGGKPAVVEARNDADKKLRDAFQIDQRKLEQLRGAKVSGADRAKLEDVVKDADGKLRARLTKALDEVAALTLGREGHEDEAGASPKASGSPSPRPSGSPESKAALTADAQARIDLIVTVAVADLDKIVAGAQQAAATLPTSAPGPGDRPSGKPSDNPGGKPSDRPAETARPTNR